MKLRLDQQSIDVFTNKVCTFVKSEATPGKYVKMKGQQESEMQKHFGRFMSTYYDVLREVSITACGEDGTWEIDESIRTKVQQDFAFYTIELKFHGKGMSDSRQYAEEVKEDIKRMVRVSNKYYDVLLGGICFITCDSENVIDVCKYAQGYGLQPYVETTQEDGYIAVVITIVPDINRDDTAPQYSRAWRERLENVRNDDTEQENYFRKRLIQMKQILTK